MYPRCVQSLSYCFLYVFKNQQHIMQIADSALSYWMGGAGTSWSQAIVDNLVCVIHSSQNKWF